MLEQDEGGIWTPFEAFYIESMLWHTTSAQRSIDVVRRWLGHVRDADRRALELPRHQLFEQLQNILHQAGCISRYLFPPWQKKMHLGRALHLRQALVVTQSSALADRELRDAIEHFDERLDKYLAQNVFGQFVPEDVRESPPGSDVPMHVFKGFYTDRLLFVLLGKPYEMAPIVEEMCRIHAALQGCVERGYRLPARLRPNSTLGN